MKYNSIGEQLIAKAQELDPSYKPDKFNDMSEAIDVILNNTGGGGKSVPPTLNLIDFEAQGVRTAITEEEYNNLKNGLYNQVLYDTEATPISIYSPSKLFNMGGEYIFIQFKISFNADETISYSSMVVNTITIGEKNTSNEYPITVNELAIINPPSDGSGSINVISYCAIRDFNDGDHDDNSFVMPTRDVVVFIDQNGKSLIGTKNTQDNVISYICYERTIVVESGQYEYKFFVYKITKSNRGYNVEKADLSAALDENILFLPYYSDNDNGKILAINSGNPKWVDSSSASKTISLFGGHSILVPLNSEDSSINLFRHDITSVNGNNQLLIQIYSSKNLSVKSLGDLGTLLGILHRKIVASGIYENSPIFMIDWKNETSSVFYTVANPTTGIPLSTFATLKDTVTTV